MSWEVRLIIPEQRWARNSPCCIVFSAVFYMMCIFFDHWSTHRNIHELRGVFQTIEMLAYPRGSVLSRMKSKSSTCTVASPFVCTSPLAARAVARVSAGASFLLQCCFFRSVLKFRSIRTALIRTSVMNHTLRRTLSFRIFTWRDVPLENCALRFGPKDFVPFRKIELVLAALRPGIRNLPAWNSSIWRQNLYHKFRFRFFVGLTVNLSVHKSALFTGFAS